MSITRERLLEIIVTGPEASGAEQNELARMALAAMDSEPVAEIMERLLQAGTLTNEDTRKVDELTMWIKRLVRSLKNANPDSKLPREAMDYLTAKGLISVGDILR